MALPVWFVRFLTPAAAFAVLVSEPRGAAVVESGFRLSSVPEDVLASDDAGGRARSFQPIVSGGYSSEIPHESHTAQTCGRRELTHPVWAGLRAPCSRSVHNTRQNQNSQPQLELLQPPLPLFYTTSNSSSRIKMAALTTHPSRSLPGWASSLLLFLGPTLPSTSPAFLGLLHASPATVDALFAHHLLLNRVPLVCGPLGNEMWYVANDYALAGLPTQWVGDANGCGLGVEVGFYALPLTGDVLPRLHDWLAVIPSRHGWLGPAALEDYLASSTTNTTNPPRRNPDALAYADHARYMLAHLLEGYAAECDWAGKTRMRVGVDIFDGMPPDRRVRRAVRGVMEGRGFRREGPGAWVTREEREIGPAHRHRTHRSMSSIELPVSPVSSIDFDLNLEDAE
ncbi:hypothetical protein IWZ01DRAFT_487126 [Phyllosticta capitalensis]